MLLLAAALLIILIIVTITVIFVALKLFTHFRAVQAEEDREKQENGSEFAGIRKNSSFARLIEKSFTNQTMTLAKTVEEAETFMFQCVYCRVVMVEVKGDWDCSHCGGSMRMTGEPGEQEESEP